MRAVTLHRQPACALAASREMSPVRPNWIASTTPLLPEPLGPEMTKLLRPGEISSVRMPRISRMSTDSIWITGAARRILREDCDEVVRLQFFRRGQRLAKRLDRCGVESMPTSTASRRTR